MLSPDSLAFALLDLSLSGCLLLRPVFTGPELVDFTYEYVNPAAQLILRLAPEPAGTVRELYPSVVETGVFAFCAQAFTSEQISYFGSDYQGQGIDAYFQLAARRHGELLLINFTGTADRQFGATELALRESQQREQAARAEAERQRGELTRVFEQAPTAIAVYRGPRYIIELANPTVCRLWGRRAEDIVGLGLFEALPEVAGMGYEELLDGVMATGQPVVMHGMEAQHERHGRRETVYWDFVYTPMYEADGSIYGAMVVATEVTEQVLARWALEQLNQELEARVQERTQALATEQQRLRDVFEQAPLALCVFQGPEYVLDVVNSQMLHMWDRTHASLLGRPFFEALPELQDQGLPELLAEVRGTGQAFEAREMAFHLARHQPGEVGYYDFVYEPLRDEHGQVSAVLCVASEVTQNVRARQQVEQLNEELEARVQARTQELEAARATAERERAQLQALLTQAPVAIALFESQQVRVASANKQMAALWGRTPEQVVGRTLLEAVPELTGQGFEQMIQQVEATGVPYIGTEAPATILKDGQLVVRYYNFSCQPLYDTQGALLGVLNVGVEVTEQVEARRALEQLNQELEARVQQRTQQLAAQQRLLRQILGQVPAAIATLSGPEHRYSFFNDPYQALSAGRTALGLTVAEVFPEVVEQGFLDLLDQVYATGQPFIGTETLAMLHDEATGQVEARYVDFIYQPLFDEQQPPQPQGILAFILDVTERVRARKQAETLQAAMLAVAQRQAQQRQDIYQIFEQTPVAIVLLREPAHRIDYFNSAFTELFPPEQWTGGTLQGHRLGEVYPRLREEGIIELLDRVFATGESQLVREMPLAKLQPGSPRFVTFAYQAYREQGRIVGVAAFVYDVTEHVLAREQIEASARQLRLLTDALPVLIGYIDRDLVYRFANQAYQTWFQQNPAAVVGQRVPERVGEEAFKVSSPRMAQALAGERVEFTARMAYRPDFIRYVRSSYIPDVQAGQVAGFYLLASDITDEREAQERIQALNQELQTANEQLLRTNADLDTFVYTASHDLKSPITNIEGLLNALQEHLPASAREEPLVARLLTMMQGAVGRFQDTLGHLTDLSRLQHEQNQPAELIDLPALVEAVRLDMLPELTAAGATLELELAACPTIRFSVKNLRSVIYNLLSNAVKYRAPERSPLVRLRCHHAAPGQVMLEVEDNGLGLSEQQQGELFRLFRRLHTHVGGSGVGLHMVKRLLENAGGTIAVRSQLGVGSTFTVTLPVLNE